MAELNPKKNPWDKVAPLLKVDENSVAKFEEADLYSEKGVVKSKSIKNGIIH